MFVSRDIIQQMIEQLAQAVLRAAGGRRSGKLEEAEEELGKVGENLSGGPLGMIESVDTATAATLLSDAQAVRLYGDYVAERGLIRQANGHPRDARLDLNRALELYRLALEIGERQSWPRDEADMALDALEEIEAALHAYPGDL